MSDPLSKSPPPRGSMQDEHRSRPQTPELDPEVIHQAIFEGSVDALVRIYRHYDARVRYQLGRVAFKAGHRRDVEDLVQEVWSRLLHHDRRILRHYDRTKGHFGPFLHCVVHQQAWQVLKREHHKQLGDISASELDELADEAAVAFIAELAQSDLLRRILDEADAQLSADDRTLLREHHVHGRTLRSVAAELGVNELTLHKRNQRLKQRLAALAEQLLAPVPAPRSCDFPAQRATVIMIAIALLWGPWIEDDGWAGPYDDEPSPRPLLID